MLIWYLGSLDIVVNMKGEINVTAAKLSASEYVYNELKDEIMFLELLPGQNINEVETSNRFNVSRTPVRSAFSRLESEGLVEIRPKYGSFVTLIDIDDISDIMYMREKLELSVVNEIENISKSQEVKIDVLLLRQKKITNSDLDEFTKAQRFLEADNKFHAMIFSLANRESIWRKLTKDNPHYNRLRLLSNRENINKLKEIQKDHKEIVRCLVDNDFESLNKFYNKHIYEGVRNLPEIVDKYSEYFK